MGDYGLSVTTNLDYEAAVKAIRAALAVQGFGVLTQIDIQATLKAKLDANVEPHIILGACNPSFAHQALQADPDVGLLLPCNVTVRADEQGVKVSAINPKVLASLAGPALEPLADQIQARLEAALAALPKA